MSKRVKLLVSLARDKYEGKVTLDVTSQCKESQLTSSSSSSPKIPLKENEQTDYFISPIHSNESDYDDSDKDPNFELPANKQNHFFLLHILFLCPLHLQLAVALALHQLMTAAILVLIVKLKI